MLISLNEIKKLVKIPAEMSDSALVERIGSRLVEVEEVIDLAPKYRGIKVVKVLEAEPIEGTHLHLCKVDAGESEPIQVVCGAPNVHAGMLTVWIMPGSVVPATYGNENFRLGVRKLQGYESHGMLAAVDELDLGDDHAGIAEIDPKFAKPGDDFAKLFELNDLIIDVENKSLTHRPDCFGLIGFAREVAGILSLPFKTPTWLTESVASCARKDNAIMIDISDSDLCPRYSCAIFDLPDNQPSKYLTSDAVFLAKAGMRAIDPMVDLTNIMMLLTGQPLHAFDYDKLVAASGKSTPEIIVRTAKPGEQLQLLDGKTISCIPEDILITANNVPVALAGAMGGKNTEIDASTRRVILESATFSLFNLRKTQMAHGIFSEAITRFTKGQPAAQTMPVLLETVHRLGVEPMAVADSYPSPANPQPISLSVTEINNLLGTDYDAKTITTALENVGFKVLEIASLSEKLSELTSESVGCDSPVTTGRGDIRSSNKDCDNDTLKVTPPVWRTDIHLKEDIIEEVGRLLGFDNIVLDLPVKPFSGTDTAPLWALKRELRGILSDRLGMHEVLTYSFVSSDLISRVGEDPEQSYQIVNSISPELQRFRQQLVPSLLDKIRLNERAGFSGFTLYELNQVSNKSWGLTAEGTPILESHLGVVSLEDFYRLKAKILAATKKGLKLTLEYTKLAPGSKLAAEYPYLEPVRSAVLMAGGEVVGAFGEVKAAVLRRFKLDAPVSAAELKLDILSTLPRELAIRTEFSRFPAVERDLTLKVAADAEFGRFDQALQAALDSLDLISEVTPGSVYQPSPDVKNISFHLKFACKQKTLDSAGISDIMEKMTVEMQKLGAEII